MKRLTRTVLVSALIVAVVAISVAPAGAAKGGTDRPFKASGDGIVTAAPFPDCDPVSVIPGDPPFVVAIGV